MSGGNDLLRYVFALLSVHACVVPAAHAQTYPVKPVRLVTSSAGSQTDTMARLIGGKLAEKWGQPVVIENRSGAGGLIASSMVAKAAPDGYTLLFQSPQFMVGAALSEKQPFDSIKDFASVARVGSSTVVLVVPATLGVKSVKEFVALAKARPAPVLFSSAGAGSSMHMNTERFKLMAQIPATHVGYKGAPEAVLEVAAGRVHYTIAALVVALPMIRDNKVLPLAVLSLQRSPALPEVPVITEVFPNYGRDGSYCMLAPAGTSRTLLRKINADVTQALALPDVKERLRMMEFQVESVLPEEADRMMRADIEALRKVARQAGLLGK
jgi:tripartite-type tricarboxylate transporter receptor subunit TctC